MKLIDENYTNNKLKFCALFFLTIALLSLPSFEAPKNIFLFLFLTTFSLYYYRDNNKQLLGYWDLIFLTYIFSAFLSALFAGYYQNNEWRSFEGMFFWMAFGWAISKIKFSDEEISWILSVILISTMIAFLWGINSFLITHQKDSLQLHSVGHQNHSAIFLGIIFFVSLSQSLLGWKSKKPLQKFISILFTIFLFIGIILEQSRATFLIAALATPSIIISIKNTKKIKIVALIIYGTLIISMFFNGSNIVTKQINMQRSNNILADRNLLWNTAIEASKFYPLLGIGNGNWKKISEDQIQKSVESRGEFFEKKKYRTDASHAHNLYLMALVERGILGLISLFLIQFSWLLLIIKSYSNLRSSNQGAQLWWASLGAWSFTFINGLVNSTFHHEIAILSLLILGLHLSFLKSMQKNLVNNTYYLFRKK